MKNAPPFIVVDNGGYHVRAGFAGASDPAVVVPNCTARIRRQLRLLVADETETSKVKDYSQLQYIRPIDRGHVTDTFIEGLIWERLFGPHLLNVDTTERSLLLTAPLFTPQAVQVRGAGAG